jgi:hypothetical protein
VRDAAVRARDQQLAYLAVHNHPGETTVRFSDIDLASHEQGYPALRQITGQVTGGVVLTSQAAAGDLWQLRGCGGAGQGVVAQYVGAAGLEEAQVVLVAPARVLAQVQLVCFAGQAAITGQNPASASRSVLVVIGYLPGRADTREAGPAGPQRR